MPNRSSGELEWPSPAVAGSRTLDAGLCLVDHGEHPTRLFQEHLAGPGQPSAPRGALEQLHAQAVLQFLDDPREG